MRYIYLLTATYVLSLVLGAVAAWMISVNPWSGPLHHLAQWLIEFERVKSRYEISESFCGYCGDLYLLTVGFFLVLTIFYLSALVCKVIAYWYTSPKEIFSRDAAEKLLKAVWQLLLVSGMFAGMLWALLFMPEFARPSVNSPSSSEYSMFGFTLIFLATTAFHFLALAVAALASILTLYLHSIRMGRN